MLPLDSSRWTELTDAYGPASSIPRLIRDLERYPPGDDERAEPYFSLWGALCHQGTAYPASFAAFPHLVDALERQPTRAPWTLYLLIGAIEASRSKVDDAPLPPDLAPAYFDALAKVPQIAMRAASEPWDELRCRVILACVAAVKGHPRLSEAIEELEPDVIDSILDRE